MAEEATVMDAPPEKVDGINKGLADEINRHTESISDEIDRDRNERLEAERGEETPSEEASDDVTTDLPAAEVQAVDESGGKAPEPGKEDDAPTDTKADESVAIPDANIERAVKAGMPMADAREFNTPEALDRMVSMLETANGDDPTVAVVDEVQQGDDPLSGVPDLDPEEYDEKIVAGLNALKNALRTLQTENAELRDQENVASYQNWYEGQINTLGAESTAALSQPGVRDALLKKFDVLAAGYEVTGDNVNYEDVFKEASGMVLGEAISKDSDVEKTGRLKKRNSQKIARAVPGKKPTFENVEEQTADEIDRKYFDKSK